MSREILCFLCSVTVFFFLGLTACSKAPDEPPKTGKVSESSTQPPEIIKDIQKPVKKARATQELGEERARAMDEAIESQKGQ